MINDHKLFFYINNIFYVRFISGFLRPRNAQTRTHQKDCELAKISMEPPLLLLAAKYIKSFQGLFIFFLCRYDMYKVVG